MNFETILTACADANLAVFAAFHPSKAIAPTGAKTLILLGPQEPGFWRRVSKSPEFKSVDPIDRWSKRVIDVLAHDLGARPIYPFGGPPHQPFVTWALASGRVWSSPVQLLVHNTAGLQVSFRGALAFSQYLEIPPATYENPCDTCLQKPCLDACPAQALGREGYDVARCHAWLDGDGATDCLSDGCIVRRACPISRTYGSLGERPAHHMRYFHKD